MDKKAHFFAWKTIFSLEGQFAGCCGNKIIAVAEIKYSSYCCIKIILSKHWFHTSYATFSNTLVSFFPEASAPLPLTREPLPTSPPPPSSRCMWHSVSKHEKHEYEVVCSNHPIKYWMLEPTVLDQNYFKLFVHNLRDFLPTFLAISWKYTNSISGLNTLFSFKLSAQIFSPVPYNQ